MSSQRKHLLWMYSLFLINCWTSGAGEVHQNDIFVIENKCLILTVNQIRGNTWTSIIRCSSMTFFHRCCLRRVNLSNLCFLQPKFIIMCFKFSSSLLTHCYGLTFMLLPPTSFSLTNRNLFKSSKLDQFIVVILMQMWRNVSIECAEMLKQLGRNRRYFWVTSYFKVSTLKI